MNTKNKRVSSRRVITGSGLDLNLSNLGKKIDDEVLSMKYQNVFLEIKNSGFDRYMLFTDDGKQNQSDFSKSENEFVFMSNITKHVKLQNLDEELENDILTLTIMERAWEYYKNGEGIFIKLQELGLVSVNSQLIKCWSFPYESFYRESQTIDLINDSFEGKIKMFHTGNLTASIEYLFSKNFYRVN